MKHDFLQKKKNIYKFYSTKTNFETLHSARGARLRQLAYSYPLKTGV